MRGVVNIPTSAWGCLARHAVHWHILRRKAWSGADLATPLFLEGLTLIQRAIDGQFKSHIPGHERGTRDLRVGLARAALGALAHVAPEGVERPLERGVERCQRRQRLRLRRNLNIRFDQYTLEI